MKAKVIAMRDQKLATREEVISYLLIRIPSLTKTQIMKLSYFADLEHMARHGSMLSEASYSRHHYGAVDYTIPDVARNMPGVECRETPDRVLFRAVEGIQDSACKLTSSARAVLDYIIAEYGSRTATWLGEETKRTAPWINAVGSSSLALNLRVVENSKRSEYLQSIRDRIDRSRIGSPEEIARRNELIREDMEKYKVEPA